MRLSTAWTAVVVLLVQGAWRACTGKRDSSGSPPGRTPGFIMSAQHKHSLITSFCLVTLVSFRKFCLYWI